MNGDWSWKIRVNRYGGSPWSCFRALEITLAVAVAVAVAVESRGWHEREIKTLTVERFEETNGGRVRERRLMVGAWRRFCFR